VIRAFGTETARSEPFVTFYDFTVNFALRDIRDRALAFERLLVHRFALARMADWKAHIDAAFTIETELAAEKLLIAHFRGRSRVADAATVLRAFSPIFDTRVTRQLYFSMRAEVLCAGQSYRDLARKSAELDAMFRELTSEESQSRERPRGFGIPAMARVYVRVLARIANLSTMHVVPFYRRYFRIMAALREIKQIERTFMQNEELVGYAVFWSIGGPEFLSTVVKISALLIHNLEFVVECQGDDTVIWYEFEEHVRKLTPESTELRELRQQVEEALLGLL
jgi:hypothetical protein